MLSFGYVMVKMASLSKFFGDLMTYIIWEYTGEKIK